MSSAEGRLHPAVIPTVPSSPYRGDQDSSSDRAYSRRTRQVERSHRIDSDEFYRFFEGEVIDDATLFAERLQQWKTTTTTTVPTASWPTRRGTNASDGRHKTHCQGPSVAHR